MLNRKNKTRELKGDGLRIEIEVNDSRLEIAGDGCRVKVSWNRGIIIIIGDGCSVRVKRNDGEIEYKGDGGRISLGIDSEEKFVNYIGDGGRIKTANGSKEKSDKSSSSSSASERVIKEDRTSVSDSEFELKKARMIRRQDKLSSDKEIGCKSNGNKLESCETERRKKINNKNNIKRHGNCTVITKITTENIPVIAKTNDLVNNWFRNPSSILKSFKFNNSAESL